MRKLFALAIISLILLAACSPPAPQQPTGRLVFERAVDDNTDIYMMDIDGTGLTRLTDSDGWDGTPSWSPDGKQIVFASERLGSPAIFIMDADGSNQRSLTSPDYASLMPVWSPDGSKIAFASTQAYEVLQQGGRQQFSNLHVNWHTTEVYPQMLLGLIQLPLPIADGAGEQVACQMVGRQF